MKSFISVAISIIVIFSMTTATASHKAETPSENLHIACAIKAGSTWQLKPNETINTSWRKLNRTQWEFTLTYEQKKALCVIQESGEIISFTDA